MSSSIWTHSVDYSDGTPALRFTSDGSGEVYYHQSLFNHVLEEAQGRIPKHKEIRAVAARVVSFHKSARSRKQFQHTFYQVPNREAIQGYKSGSTRDKVAKLTGNLLANFNEHNIGFAYEKPPSTKEKAKGHGQKRVLTITGKGGQMSDETTRNIVHSWMWNPGKQASGTVPDEITFDMNPYFTFRFFESMKIEVRFQCGPVEHKFDLGAITEARLRFPAEGERQECKDKSHPSAKDETTRSKKLEEIFNSLDNSMRAVNQPKTLKTKKELRNQAWERTAHEVPSVVRGSFGNYKSQENNVLEDANLGEVEDGYGTVAGASYHKGKWLGRYEVRQKLEGIHPSLPRSEALQRNSGKTTDNMSSLSAISPVLRSFLNAHKKVPRISPEELSRYVEKAPKDKLVVVSCIREDEPLCRKAVQLLEHVLATLCIMYPFSSEFKDQTLLLTDEDQKVLGTMSLAARGSMKGSPQDECPFRLIAVDMAHNRNAAKELNVSSLPYYFMYYNGQMVYRGMMGGTDRVTLSVCNRKVNVLALEPQSSHQIYTDRAAQAAGTPCVLAAGSFHAKGGRNVRIVEEALKRIDYQFKMADTRRKHEKASKPSDGLAGCDATSELAGDFSIVLIDANPDQGVEAKDLPSLKGSLEKAADRSGREIRNQYLVGHSLLVSVVERGTVMPGKSSWKANSLDAILYGATGENPLHYLSKHSSLEAAKKVLSRHASRNSTREDKDEEDTQEDNKSDGSWTVRTPDDDISWVCPRTGVIQNPTSEHTLQGHASVAVMRPIRKSTLDTLSKIWLSLMGNKAAFPGHDPGSAGVHLGMTHNDVIERMHNAITAGQNGQFLSETRGGGLSLSSNEIRIRGVPLGSH